MSTESPTEIAIPSAPRGNDNDGIRSDLGNNEESQHHDNTIPLGSEPVPMVPPPSQTLSSLKDSPSSPFFSSSSDEVPLNARPLSRQFHIASVNMPANGKSPLASGLNRAWTFSSSASSSQTELTKPESPRNAADDDDTGKATSLLPPVGPTAPAAVTIAPEPVTKSVTKPSNLLALRRRSSLSHKKYRPPPPTTTSAFRSTTPRLSSPVIGSTPTRLGPGSYAQTTARDGVAGAAARGGSSSDLHVPWVLAVQFRLGRVLTPASSSISTFSGCGHDDGGFAEACHTGDAWGQLVRDVAVPPNVLITQRAVQLTARKVSSSKSLARPVSPPPPFLGPMAAGRPVGAKRDTPGSLIKQATLHRAASSSAAAAAAQSSASLALKSLTQAGLLALPDVRKTLDGRPVFSDAFFSPAARSGVKSQGGGWGSRRGSRRESVTGLNATGASKPGAFGVNPFSCPSNGAVLLSPKLNVGTGTGSTRRKSSVSQVANLLLQRKQQASVLEPIAG